MILVNYTRLDKPLPELVLRHVLRDLPADKASAIMRSGNEQSRSASILGLLMLEDAAQQLGIKNFHFSQLIFPPNQKPLYQGNIEFNITHSGAIAACAVSDSVDLGIDSESRQTPIPRPLHNAFIDNELEKIASGSGDFYELWVQKEAVAKAAGCGIACMKQIQINDNMAHHQGQSWFLHRLMLDDGDVSYLACRQKNPAICIHYYKNPGCEINSPLENIQIQHCG